MIFMYQIRVRDLCEDRDLSKKEIADRLNVHQTTYSDYELDNLHIPIVVLHKLADFYGVSVDYLLDRTDVKNRIPRRNKRFPLG